MQAKLIKDLLNEEYSQSFLEWFKNSKVVDKQGNPLVVYHGSPNDFKEFMYKYVGKTGTSRGYGFYFTDIKEFAAGFKENDKGKLYEVYLKIIKPLDDVNKKITKIQLSKFISSLDPDGNDYLSNYGDIHHKEYNKILKHAIENEYLYNDNDVDLIHSIINANGSNFEKDYKILYKTLGYDGIISRNHETMLYIVFFPWQIKSINAVKYSDLNNDIFENIKDILIPKTTQEILKNLPFDEGVKQVLLDNNCRFDSKTSYRHADESSYYWFYFPINPIYNIEHRFFIQEDDTEYYVKYKIKQIKDNFLKDKYGLD